VLNICTGSISKSRKFGNYTTGHKKMRATMFSTCAILKYCHNDF
jgi:hypothetical protein